MKNLICALAPAAFGEVLLRESNIPGEKPAGEVTKGEAAKGAGTKDGGARAWARARGGA